MHYIYLKSTRAIVGFVYPRKTAGMVTEAIRVEIVNLTNSELGGVIGDYEVVEGTAEPEGKVAEINTDFELAFVTDPQIAVKAERQVLETKLTDDSITFTEMKKLMRLRV